MSDDGEYYGRSFLDTFDSWERVSSDELTDVGFGREDLPHPDDLMEVPKDDE